MTKLFNCPVKRSMVLWVVGGVFGGALVMIAIGLGVGLSGQIDGTQQHGGAVSTISQICADIGSDMLKRNGSAVDAALAVLFCEGASTPQSMGLGGGFVAVMYSRQTGIADALIARETAPAASHQDMFVGESGVKGIMAVAVPSELKGYGAMHARFGRLPWAEIIKPSIDMCRNGYPITPFLAIVLEQYRDMMRDSLPFREVFWNEKENRLARVGEYVKHLRLAETLEAIVREGPQSMYNRNGTVAQRLTIDVDSLGGILTMQDLEGYRVRWERPDSAQILGNKMMYTTPLPASGSLLAFIMNLLDEFLPESLGMSTIFYHRIVEAFKFAFARRTNLGDPQFVEDAKDLVKNLTSRQYAQEIREQVLDGQTFNDIQHYGANFSMVADNGTAHISVLAPNGDAVSITSTVNTFFGSKIMSPTTGIILNDEMDDFSTPGITNSFGLEASPANYIVPGKMPLSSMCPAIIVDASGDVEMIVGGAGGSKITTGVTLNIVDHLVRDISLETIMMSPRLHHQLLPMEISYEDGFDPVLLQGLEELGHKVKVSLPSYGFGAVSAISRKNGVLTAVSDNRRNGSVAFT